MRRYRTHTHNVYDDDQSCMHALTSYDDTGHDSDQDARTHSLHVPADVGKGNAGGELRFDAVQSGAQGCVIMCFRYLERLAVHDTQGGRVLTSPSLPYALNVCVSACIDTGSAPSIE